MKINLGFTTFEFLFLLPVVVLIYHLCPRRWREWFLLLVNLCFYASFGPIFLMAMTAEALVAWGTGIACSRHRNDENKRVEPVIFAGGILSLILFLIFFKLAGTYVETIIAPVGISFYTMQALSYVIDVYRRETEAEKNYFRLLTFLSFFPTVTSGPIYRYRDFGRQLAENRDNLRADYIRIMNGIICMIYGYFLKLVIAERARILVDQVFGNYKEYGAIVLALAAVAYSIQIYADFAGYSAIVIGIAQILGFTIAENFRAPYLSLTIKEFWNRWHVSLSMWLKDYIYIPLGGNRKGRSRKYVNILLVFLVSGFWHGTQWHFIVWGGIHGIYQIVGDISKKQRDKIRPWLGLCEDTAFYRLLQRLVTFILVTVAWIFFRTGLRDALRYIHRMLVSRGELYALTVGGGIYELGLSSFFLHLLPVAVLFMLFWDVLYYRTGKRIDRILEEQGSFARCAVVIAMLLVILIWGVYGDQHDASYFVYSQF